MRLAKRISARSRIRGLLAAAVATPLGCSGSQAVLAPSGPHADTTAAMAWLLFAGAGAIFAAVLATIAIAARGPAGARTVLGSDRTILALGFGLPVATLSGLLVHGLRSSAELAGAATPPALAIEVRGEQWWWRVAYLDESGRRRFETANEIRIPVGVPVQLRLTSGDVIHSFWVPQLAGKLDMIPGRTNHLRIQADRAGVYRGQCAEFCGGAHAMMAFHVVAEAPAAFEDWLRRQREPAAAPRDDEAERGRAVFLANGCGLCHHVAGTAAAGRVGPDLTHVGGRLHLVAGWLPNHRGSIAGWIASAQHLKPDNRMPSFTQIAGADLRALAVWLEGLE